ncbi:hypothetical protein LOC72_21235, partial [Roseiconus lacunae]
EHGTKPLIIDEPLAILEIAKNSGPHHRASDGIANVRDQRAGTFDFPLEKPRKPDSVASLGSVRFARIASVKMPKLSINIPALQVTIPGNTGQSPRGGSGIAM